MTEDRFVNIQKKDRLPGYEWDKLRSETLVIDNNKCVECGDKAVEVDHKTPLALGGTNDINNLQSLCSSCHKKKTVEDHEKIKRVRRNKRADKYKGVVI